MRGGEVGEFCGLIYGFGRLPRALHEILAPAIFKKHFPLDEVPQENFEISPLTLLKKSEVQRSDWDSLSIRIVKLVDREI